MPVDLTGKSAPGDLNRQDFLGPVGKAHPWAFSPTAVKDPIEPKKANAPSAEEMAFDQVVKTLSDSADLFAAQSKMDAAYVRNVVSAYDLSRERTKESIGREPPLLKDASTNESFRESMETEFKNLVGEIDPLLELAKRGIKPGSIYTHDIYLLKAINHLNSLITAQNKSLGIYQVQEKGPNGNVVERNVDEVTQELSKDFSAIITQDIQKNNYYGQNDRHSDYKKDYNNNYNNMNHLMNVPFSENFKVDPIGSVHRKSRPVSNFYAEEFKPFDDVFHEAKNREGMRISMRQIAYQTEGITGDLKEQQNIFYNIDHLTDSITATVKRRSVI